MKKRQFKNPVFECSVQNSENEIQRLYITAQNRFDAYEELCRLYPVRAGYCKRFVLGQI